jgi:hypothetical protein
LWFNSRHSAEEALAMTPNDFRKMALSFPEAVESSHIGHPDFRVGGKIFATLGYPEESWAMVKLAPVEQEMFVKAEPKAFAPVKGGWGLKGATNVVLKAAKKESVRRALAAAWSLAAPKKLAEQFGAKS